MKTKLSLLLLTSTLFSNPGYNSYLSDASNPEYYSGDGGFSWGIIIFGVIMFYLYFGDSNA